MKKRLSVLLLIYLLAAPGRALRRSRPGHGDPA
jgi:hypothetical protein